MTIPISNMELIFNHYFPTLNSDSAEFHGFSVALNACHEEAQRNTIALNVKAQLVKKLEGDVVDLKRKIAAMNKEVP